MQQRLFSTPVRSSPRPHSPTPPATRDHITVAEVGSEFLYASPDNAEYTLSAVGVEKWWKNDIVISSDPQDTTSLDQRTQSHFVPVQESRVKKAFNMWKDFGLLKALSVLAGKEEDDDAVEEGTTEIVFSALLRNILWCKSLYNRSGRPELSSEDVLTCYTTLPNQSHCPVKVISLHPRTYVLAVCRKDDVIMVLNFMSSNNHCLMLKDAAQSCVSCMEWSTHSDNLLAVGVLGGVVLWHVDPIHFSSRYVSTLLHCPDISLPVTTLSWSPHGQFLAVGSPGHSPLLIWDVSLKIYTPIKRRGGGVVLVNWSLDGEKVFVSHSSSVFRVWNVENWSCERWTHLSGMCKAACWSPSGDFLLLALQGDPSLYQLSFSIAGTSTYSAIKCADLSPAKEPSSPDINIGGCVQSMAWDKRGERLAVIFTDDSPSADKIGIFRTRCSPVMEVLRGGFVQGLEGEVPVGVEFHRDYQNGALLVTVWSSGRISFTPFVFTPPLVPSLIRPPLSSTLYSQQ